MRLSQDRLRKLVDSAESLLVEGGVSGKPIEDTLLEILSTLITAIWDNNAQVRAEFASKTEFMRSIKDELKRGSIKSRYERDPVV